MTQSHTAAGNLLIRDAVWSDLEAICAIYKDTVETTLISWDETPPSLFEMRDRFRDLTDQGFPYLVAEKAGSAEVIGYAHAAPFHRQSGWRYTAEHSIYIRMDCHRLGAGRALMHELMRQLKQRGFRTLIAGVGQPGAQPSMAFHQAMGFELAGVLTQTGFKNGQWLDAVFMTKDLGVPDDMSLRRPVQSR